MKLEKCTEPVVNKLPFYSLYSMTSARSTQCTNSVSTGIKIFSCSQLSKVESRCSRIESRPSPSSTLLRSTKLFANHSSRSISSFSLCKCALDFKWPNKSSMRKNGASSSEEDKFLIEQHKKRSPHTSNGSPSRLGTILLNWRKYCQRLSPASQLQLVLIPRNGIGGSFQSNLNHPNQPNFLVKGRRSVRIDSRR